MDVYTGDCIDVYRAVRKAVYRDDYIVINYIGRLQNLPSILVLRISRVLELYIGL